MEKKLTIAHLSPYLPYGLKVNHITYFENVETRIITTSLESLSDECATFSEGMDYYFDDPMDNECSIKPLFRPLSQLTEEIEHNGERFVPSEKLQEIRRGVSLYKPMSDRFPLEINIDTEDYAHQVDLYDGYSIMQKLFEWHFDVFSLIPQRLAIEKGAEG